jgi:hypothetical protein
LRKEELMQQRLIWSGRELAHRELQLQAVVKPHSLPLGHQKILFS